MYDTYLLLVIYILTFLSRFVALLLCERYVAATFTSSQRRALLYVHVCVSENVNTLLQLLPRTALLLCWCMYLRLWIVCMYFYMNLFTGVHVTLFYVRVHASTSVESIS